MKKSLFAFFVLAFICTNVVTAQVTAKPVKKVATLSMPGETGANGGSVAWHPVLKKYYASFAGNMTYPFAVFDATGKRLSVDTMEAMFDVRGLWYNTVTKKIEANGYDDNGWISYILDAKGIPEDYTQLHEGQVQPGAQSVGVFDVLKKRVSFFNEGRIVSYSPEGEEQEDVIELKLGGGEEPGEGELEDVEDQLVKYNASALCYTGIVNAEFAVLNTTDKQIELYSRKGILTKAFKLPENVQVYGNLNFAYANATWWMFDKDERKWVGFK